MAKKFFRNALIPVRILVISALLCASDHAFSQSPDSSKTRKSATADTSKYGVGKLALLGHVRKVALPALKDSDGDGVPDQLDLEPNTPPGVDVDSHGRAIDTDGDGVPDYRDKEKLTPQKCFPVDSNGVGRCPECACCKEVREAINRLEEDNDGEFLGCHSSQLPSVKFNAGSAVLNKNAIIQLDSIAKLLVYNPRCKCEIFASAYSDKETQKIEVSRINAVTNYLEFKGGLSAERIKWIYDDVITHPGALHFMSY